MYTRNHLWNYAHEKDYDYRQISPDELSEEDSAKTGKNVVYLALGPEEFQFRILQEVIDAFNLTSTSPSPKVPKKLSHYGLFYPRIDCVTTEADSLSTVLTEISENQQLINEINENIILKSISSQFMTPSSARELYSRLRIPQPIRLIVYENIEKLAWHRSLPLTNELRHLNFVFNATDSLPAYEKTVILLTMSSLPIDHPPLKTLVSLKEQLGIFFQSPNQYFNGNAFVGRINRFAVDGFSKQVPESEHLCSRVSHLLADKRLNSRAHLTRDVIQARDFSLIDPSMIENSSSHTLLLPAVISGLALLLLLLWTFFGRKEEKSSSEAEPTRLSTTSNESKPDSVSPLKASDQSQQNQSSPRPERRETRAVTSIEIAEQPQMEPTALLVEVAEEKLLTEEEQCAEQEVLQAPPASPVKTSMDRPAVVPRTPVLAPETPEQGGMRLRSNRVLPSPSDTSPSHSTASARKKKQSH